MSEKSWAQIRAELEMLPRQMCITPVAEVREYIDEILKLQEQLQSAQAEAEKWKRKHEECAKISMMLADRNVEQGDEIERLREEREKLIEGLRTGLMHAGSWGADDYVSLMRDTLKECGVMVE